MKRLFLAILMINCAVFFKVKAQGNFDDLIELSKTAKDKEQIRSLVDRAAELSQDNPDQGKKLSIAILNQIERLDYVDFTDEINVWYGNSLLNLEKYDSAILVFNKIEIAYSGIPESIILVQRNFYKAVCHYYLGEYPVAISLMLAAIKSPVLVEDAKFHSRNLRFLGEVYRAADNPGPSLDYIQRALAISEEAKDSVGISASLNRLGVVYYQIEEHQISEKLLKRSLEISLAANIESLTRNNFNDLGELYFAIKAFEKCIALYEQALALSANDSDRINTLNNIARLDWELGRYTEAIERAKEALVLAEELDIQTFKVDASKIIADSYESVGNFSNAAAYYKRYIVYFEKLYEEEKNRQVVELETKYQTAQKELEIIGLTEKEAIERKAKSMYEVGLIIAGTFLAILVLLTFQIRKNNKYIKAQNSQLDKLNQSKDKFFSIIAHDLRSPMIGLQGVGQKLEYFIRKNKQEKLLEMGNQIDQSIDQLNHLLNNLLNWAVSQTGGIPNNPENIDLNKLTAENINLYQSQAQTKEIQISNKLDDLKVYADLNTMATVIRNLLSNAIKFTRVGGEIIITGDEAGEYVIMRIKDEGPGIEANQLKSLFSNGKKSGVGTGGEKGFGLGLELCREFVEMNKGSINASSQLGKGTTFIISLPIKAP